MYRFNLVARVTSQTPTGFPVTRLVGACRADSASEAIAKMRGALLTTQVHRIRATQVR